VSEGRLTLRDGRMNGVELRVRTNVGHLEAYHRHDEILGELLGR
jgi:hypothetical protein